MLNTLCFNIISDIWQPTILLSAVQFRWVNSLIVSRQYVPGGSIPGGRWHVDRDGQEELPRQRRGDILIHKRYAFMDPYGPLINPRWNRHQRIHRRADESAEDNEEFKDMDENDPELGELMMEKGVVSLFPLPTLRMQACSWGWWKGDDKF